MAINRIQFQPGLPMPEFQRCFGTEEQCAAAVAAARWPNGFACPRCELLRLPRRLLRLRLGSA